MNPIIDYGEVVIFAVLAGASILALAVILERIVIFRKSAGRDAAEFIEGLSLKLRLHDLESAAACTHDGMESVYRRFAGFALAHYAAGHDGLQDLMEGKIVQEKIRLEERLSILNTLGNNAPFIGLLGTVLGVIKAFYGLGTLGSAGAEVVMRSISSALVATAAGLAVAIPVVMANNYFSRNVKIILENLHVISREFMASYSHTSLRRKKEAQHAIGR